MDNWKPIESAPTDIRPNLCSDVINQCWIDYFIVKWQKLRILEHDSLDANFIARFTMSNVAKVLNSLAEKGYAFTLQEFRQTGSIAIIKTKNPEPPKDSDNG